MKKLYLTCIPLMIVSVSLACTFETASFCNTVDDMPNDLIVSAYVVEEDDDGITVEVIEVLRGEEHRDMFRIWDGTDFDCNGYFSMVAGDFTDVGDTMIFVLPVIDSLENDWEVLGDYRWPNVYTETTVLRVVENQVTGFLSGLYPGWEQSVSSYPYTGFIESWLEGTDCQVIVDIDDEEPLSLKIYPNPCIDQLIIDDNTTFDAISILSVDGMEVSRATLSNQSHILDLRGLKPGIYLMIFTDQNARRVTERIIKL